MYNRVVTCGQKSGDLCTREWTLVDKRVETCGQDSGDLGTHCFVSLLLFLLQYRIDGPDIVCGLKDIKMNVELSVYN